MIAHRWQATAAGAQNPAYAGNDDFFYFPAKTYRAAEWDEW